MRVIGGKVRGTKLDSLEGIITRPTLDRIKESMFNIIQKKIEDSYVLDLFSGSGALAIETLSRGAKEAILCDKSKDAIKIIKKNIEKTHFENKVTIINKDYLKCLDDINKKFDIIFLDPPYDSNFAENAIKIIIKKELLSKDGIIIFETDKNDISNIEKLDINIYDLRKYGRVKLVFLNRKE